MKDRYSAAEVAEKLGTSEREILDAIAAGRLQAADVGGAYVITRSDLASYLKSEARVDELFGTGRTGAGPARRAEGPGGE